MRNFRPACIIIFLILMVSGCGGLRYSQVDPEARNFHPKRMGVLPVDVETYEEARGNIDQVIADVLLEKGWFSDVVSGDAVNRQYQSNDELRKVVIDYTTKLRAVNFSDPQLSNRIGELCNIDAFLVFFIHEWNYAMEKTDKVAKVGLSVKLIEAATGRVLWEAGHSKAEKYLLIKPELPNVARSLIKEMVAEMPH